MQSGGIAQMLKRRGLAAGIAGLDPHQLRHSAVHAWLANGGAEGDAMRLFGWKSRQMLSRYASSTADSAPAKLTAAAPSATASERLPEQWSCAAPRPRVGGVAAMVFAAGTSLGRASAPATGSG